MDSTEPQNPILRGQARSQAEARKPGLQHHMGIDTRNPDIS